MAWIKMILEGEAEGELKEHYDHNMEPWGGVDNIIKIHSLRGTLPFIKRLCTASHTSRGRSGR